jgi:hypothetical protein
MVAIHVRRTDKGTDGGIAEVYRKLLPNQQLPVSMYVDMLEALEENVLNGARFRSIFVLSDDLTIWNQRALFGARRVLFNPVWVNSSISDLLRSEAWQRGGHEKLPASGEHPGGDEPMYSFHAQLLADVYVAGRHADYLIGCGSSGVSQLIAQLMGHRFRRDSNWLALWEEDYLESSRGRAFLLGKAREHEAQSKAK